MTCSLVPLLLCKDRSAVACAAEITLGSKVVRPGERKTDARGGGGGAAGVSWCLAPWRLVFPRDLSTERWRSTHTERPVWVVRFTIATFHLHSSPPVCACCLQLLSLFSPALTPLTPLPGSVQAHSRRPSLGIKAANSSASSPTHQCCAAVVAGPPTRC